MHETDLAKSREKYNNLPDMVGNLNATSTDYIFTDWLMV
jgi:hypothetical protein